MIGWFKRTFMLIILGKIIKKLDCKRPLQGKPMKDHREFFDDIVLPHLEEAANDPYVHRAIFRRWKLGILKGGILLHFHPDDLSNMMRCFHELFTEVRRQGQETGTIPKIKVDVSKPRTMPERFNTEVVLSELRIIFSPGD